jgi:opacity protein-like surface antigen
MKKNILMITGCAMLLSVSSIAYSAEGPYISGNLGVSMPSDSDGTDSTAPGVTMTYESDKGLAFGVAGGYNFGTTRIEGEIAYQKNDLDKVSVSGIPGSVDLTGDTSNLALLLNGYYDFQNDSAFTPFISAGLGFAKIDVSDITLVGFGPLTNSDDDTVFAYQIGVGAGYAINEKTTFDVKYRYFGTSDPDFDTTSVEYSSHNFYAGVRVAF